MPDIAAAFVDYGPFAPTIAFFAVVLNVVQFFRGEIFKSFSLMPILHGQGLLSGVAVVLCICGFVLSLAWDRLNPGLSGTLMSYALWSVAVGLIAMVVFTILSLAFVRRFQWRVETEYRTLAGGPIFAKSFKETGGPTADTPDKYLQLGDFEPHNVWAVGWRFPVVLILVVSSITMQVGLIVGLTLTAQLVSEPEELLVSAPGLQMKSIPIQTLFEPDSFILIPPGPEQTAQDVAEIVSFDPALIVVRGHTDSTVGALSNQELSQNRADAVAMWLTSILEEPLAGDLPAIRSVGLADNCARVPEGSLGGDLLDAARAHNRRVELLLLEAADGAEEIALLCSPDQTDQF